MRKTKETPRNTPGKVSEVFRAGVSDGCRTLFFVPYSNPNYSASFEVFCGLANAAESVSCFAPWKNQEVSKW